MQSGLNHHSPDPVAAGPAIPRKLVLLSLPIITSMVSATVMHFVDFAMVSRLGTQAMAAIAPASITVFCFISFGMGVLSMVNTLVSQSLGRNELPECSAYAWQGLYVSLLMGGMVLILMPLVAPFFTWVGHEPQVRQMESEYVWIGLISVSPILAGMAITNFFTGIHKPMVTMTAAISANVLNVIANYALIFGNWGCPRLGVAGAAWGTVIGSALQLVILMVWFGRPASHRMYHVWRVWRPSRTRLWRIVWYGVPAGIQHEIEIFAFTIFTLFLIGRNVSVAGIVMYDPVQQAANNLCFRYLHLSFMPTVGLGIALAACVGKSIGQDRKDLARMYTNWAAVFGVIYMGLIGLCYVLFRKQMVSWLSDDYQVGWWATRLLLLCALFQVFDAIGIIYCFALRGAGDNFVPAFMMAVLAGIILVGGGFATTCWLSSWQSFGPWTAATVYIILLGVVLMAWWRLGWWERIELIHNNNE